jgi:riboflavin synthase
MFTGIIETLGTIQNKERTEQLTFTVESAITAELKIDQSVSHNGICLTVVISNNSYTVTAIDETVKKQT